jgi:hypothetical protein
VITGWVLYCLVSSTLLAAMAAGADAILTRRRKAARWVWLAAIAASIAVPAVLLLSQQRAPARIADAAEVRFDDVFQRVERRERLARSQSEGAVSERVPHVRMPQWLRADGVVTIAIISCILLATARVASDSVALFRWRRRWRSGQVDGHRVLLSERQGPALVGLLEPSIVIPEWATRLDPFERSLMLAHVREHLRARDGILASAGLLGALCMPWSPAVWWAFRRLRTAIEIDCDRRVLATFPDVARYGRLLVDVAERAADGSSLAITGFSEHTAPLVRRIRAMTARAEPERAFRSAGDVTRGAAVCGALAAMVVILPPIAPARQMASKWATPLLLPKGVGDSIAMMREGATIETQPVVRMVAIARELPASFDVVDPGTGDRMPMPGRCALRMRDARNGTEIQLRRSESATGAITQHGDTAWTRIGSVGLYRVRTPGMYGVEEGQLLRVGCGAMTKTTIVGESPGTGALSDLESTPDDRARRIASAVASAIHRKPDLVELYPGRLNVMITNPEGRNTAPAADWQLVKTVWAAVRDKLGQTAMPETLAFSVRFARGLGVTRYYYKSQAH